MFYLFIYFFNNISVPPKNEQTNNQITFDSLEENGFLIFTGLKNKKLVVLMTFFWMEEKANLFQETTTIKKSNLFILNFFYKVLK